MWRRWVRLQFDGLVDSIYEAAVLTDQWPVVLDELSKFADADAGLLFTQCGGLGRWIGTPLANELLKEYVEQGWPNRTDRAQRLFVAGRSGFINDLDVYTRDELDREPMFVEFLRPRGLGWGVATAIPIPTGDLVCFDLERRYARGPVEREFIAGLDQLRPHLARAALLSARLSLERARSAALVLDLVGLPAAVLGHNGRALTMNSTFEELMPHVVRDRSDRLELASLTADTLFAEALARLTQAGDLGSVRSIPIAAAGAEPPMILHLVPVRGAAHDLFSGAEAILAVTPVIPKQVPTAEVIQGLFDLTPAEAKVARAIAELQTVEGIADTFGLSRETVRTQLKSVLAKTGVGRQADLTALLAGASLSAA
jgi:DNA-binding CsgD family transcriptional regulator